MEGQRLSKHSYKFSIESRRSNRSSCQSLERPSWGEKSLSKNHSLIDVMSLEGGRKSDIYDRMLDEPNEPLFGRQSLGGAQGYNYGVNYQYIYTNNNDQFNQRKSQEGQITIKHACSCYTECQWLKCECLQAKNQICVKGYCCVGCIQMKQRLLLGAATIIANPVVEQTTFCTCKKTKCNKKYCSCFAAGVHCGEKCSCEGCINCPRKSQHMQIESQRQSINQEELDRMKMPEGMDFEPVEFRFSNT